MGELARESAPLVTYTFMVFGLYAVTFTERSLGAAVSKLGQWIDEKDLQPPAAGSWDIRVQAPELGYG